MNKKELKALWDKLCTQRKEVFAKIDAAKDEAELDTINLELRKLDSKITQAILSAKTAKSSTNLSQEIPLLILNAIV